MNSKRRARLAALAKRLEAIGVDKIHAEYLSIGEALLDELVAEQKAYKRSPIIRRDDLEEGILRLRQAVEYVDGVIRALEDDNPVQLIDLARGAA